MPFWESAEQKNLHSAQAVTRQALESGGIPPAARHRLELHRQSDSEFFTSDLTCNEFLLSREAGYESMGMVMGTSFYKVSFWGYFGGYQSYTGELTALSQAQLAARELAIDRLRQEAALLGAHGVIGVRLQIGAYDWSNRTVEFTAIGTAIRIADRPSDDPQPFTSDLSGQEFWQLHQAGYYPRSIVFGVCSYYIHTDGNTQSLIRGGFFGRGSGQNQEIGQYTQGFNLARHLAMQRLSADIHKHHAEGAIGMHIDMGIEDIEYELNKTTYHDLLAHFVALGTSIVSDPHPIDPKQKSPLVYYDLATGKANRLRVD